MCRYLFCLIIYIIGLYVRFDNSYWCSSPFNSMIINIPGCRLPTVQNKWIFFATGVYILAPAVRNVYSIPYTFFFCFVLVLDVTQCVTLFQHVICRGHVMRSLLLWNIPSCDLRSPLPLFIYFTNSFTHPPTRSFCFYFHDAISCILWLFA